MHNRTKILTYCALCVALCAVCAQIAIPVLQVSLTLQTFAIAFCGCFLGAKAGCAAVATYLALGALGVPVFSHFQGGFHVMAGPTGGFLYGFLFLCLGCSLFAGNKRIASAAVGLALCHVAGVCQYHFVTQTPWGVAFVTASLPFLAKDVASVALAFWLAKRLQTGLARTAL